MDLKNAMKSAPLAMLLVTLLAACAGSGNPSGSESVARTWTRGQHFLPVSALQDGQFSAINEIPEQPQNWAEAVAGAKLLPGVKLAAVIYLHGCAGNNNGSYWWRQLKRYQVAFFAPDSMSRPRKSLCDSGNMKNIRIPMRIAELRYALQQLAEVDWIDHDRLILVGFSEGAQTAAAFAVQEFRAVVLMGTNCKFSGGSPRAASEVAVLSLMGKNDHYYDGVGCRITRAIRGSDSIVIADTDHNLRHNQEALEALHRFLRQQLDR